MELRTHIEIPRSDISIDHHRQMMLFGSCFSGEIGRKLTEHKFRVEINPFGILYNPLSVLFAIERLISGVPFTSDDLFFHNGLYHSLQHHGSFSSPQREDALQRMNDRFEQAVALLPHATLLVITFGTAWVYRWKENDQVVANCHKLPPQQFHRVRLTPGEITREWEGLLSRLLLLNPEMQLLFTVSPVRHWGDGAHENQLSKSILHLAIDALQRLFPQQVAYFPAYELLMDELRDYRFYGEDMLHPSSLAVDYIWDRFSLAFFSRETQKVNREWSLLRQALEHRPLHPGSEAFQQFRRQTAERLEAFARRYPGITLDEERIQLTLRDNRL
ncbi:MAG: GSCFA domain-containing protein [bacterium]|nr:GSCFA domain-containing protein [bacterium]MDD3624399.1 GSCFA domain-containing protein [Proteiniphilum sp.]MDD3967391.1 GSCFA domain-containing protein [Proteiniphilum sp.]MDD4458361.1 GSCFA domain-containing protein [Proteiniphilum sp.]